MKRDPDKDEALFALLAASEDPHAAFAASPLANDEYARARFEDVTGMAAQLDALGDEERVSLMRALEGSVASGPAESALASLARGTAADRPGGVLRGPWRFALIAAGIAALFALPMLIGQGAGGRGSIDPGILMGDANGMLPRGVIDAVESFEWSDRERGGGTWRVFVYDKGTGTQVLASPGIETPEWSPSQSQLSALNDGPRPRAFTWKVSFDDGSGGEPFDEWQEFELR